MAGRRAEEVWQTLLDEAAEDEIDRAAATSVEQAEKDLAEAGLNQAAERARAAAFLAGLGVGQPKSGHVLRHRAWRIPQQNRAYDGAKKPPAPALHYRSRYSNDQRYTASRHS